MRAIDFVQRDGYFRPVYLSLVARATVSRHNGTPIIEQFNPIYSYWCTYRDMTAKEVCRYLGPGYLANMKG